MNDQSSPSRDSHTTSPSLVVGALISARAFIIAERDTFHKSCQLADGSVPDIEDQEHLAEVDRLLSHVNDALQDASRNTPPPCPDCEGDGEIHRGSSVPDDEGFETCLLCAGEGVLDLDNLRCRLERLQTLEGDCQAYEGEIAMLKSRIAELSHDS